VALVAALVFASAVRDGYQRTQASRLAELTAAQPARTPAQPITVRNPGFEDGGSGVPNGWMRDEARTGSKGSVAVDRSRSREGRASLRLNPNQRNGGDFPLAVAQVIPGGAYRGQEIEISGSMMTTGDATAVLGMLNFVGNRGSNLVSVSHQSEDAGWVRKSLTYRVPDDPSVQLVITCYVTGESGSAWFDDVSIAIAPASSSATRGGPAQSAPLTAAIDVDARSVVRQIPRTLYGANVEWIWNGNYLWRDDTDALDPEALRLARDLGVSLIRYPGGQYSDFYRWRSGVGPRNRRPEVTHAAGRNDRSRPNFGTDEALEFARQIGGELLVTVNAGTGDAREAADWVRYVNGASRRVRYWEVGNELYMNEGSATSRAITLNPARYADRFTEFATAMKTADPEIRLLAIGGENQGPYVNVNYSNWNRTVLERAGAHIDLLAVHNAYAPVLIRGGDKDLRTVYRAMLAAPLLIARNLRTVERQIADYAPSRASRIGIAVTEWGPLFQFDPSSRYVDHPKTLGSALFVASALKTFIESPRTEIANIFLLNDLSVLGVIGSRNGNFPANPDWTATARYFALQMYTRHFGEQLVQTRTEVGTYDSDAVGLVDRVTGVPYLDVVSSLSADGRRLYILAVNKHFDAEIDASIGLRGFAPAPDGTAWTLTGTGLDANTGTTPLRVPGLAWAPQIEDTYNPRFRRGRADDVTLTSAPFTVGRSLEFSFPPHSVTSLVLDRAR
jgi:alpha-N-arabinofuranosidase